MPEWTKYTVHTTEEAEEAVSSMLFELGITGIEIEDKKPLGEKENGGLFGDVVPALPEDDHLARISFYLERGTSDEEKIVDGVKRGLERISEFIDTGSGRITSSRTAEEDWINNWKEHFHSFSVDDILIVPTWEETHDDSEHQLVLRIDPGTAFGTGAHESTKLALLALRKYLRKGDRFLDVGTGSGILGITALKSGASHVFATDLDENVIPAVADNLAVNGIEEKDFDLVLGDLAADAGVREKAGSTPYDIAAANIIAEILCGITPAVPPLLKKGGIYITSGILNERENIVLEAAEKAGFEMVEINRMGEWSGIVFRKK